MNTVVGLTLLFAVAYAADNVDIEQTADVKSGAQPKYWRAILGDICQLPSFPRATGDPLRYLECVRQSSDITDRKDLGIWLLRECLPGYEFVASARRCKTIRSVKRQQELCDGPNASNYQFCPQNNDNNEHFIVHEIRQAPKQCACPNGEKNCVCPTPEILEPQLVKSKVVRRRNAPMATISICSVCPSKSTSCYCPSSTQQQMVDMPQQQQQSPQWDNLQQPGPIPPPSPELQRPTYVQQDQPTQVVQQVPTVPQIPQTTVQPQVQTPVQVVQQAQQPTEQCPCPETACVCISIGVGSSANTATGDSTINNSINNDAASLQPTVATTSYQGNCQTTTTQQQYCPQNDQEQYIVQPQPCPLVQGQSTVNAQYQGICSWMVDPLAIDQQSRTHYLQCQPAPNNLFCGRWQRMPCAPGTVFDVSAQVCVWDSSSSIPGSIPTATQIPMQYQSSSVQQFQPSGTTVGPISGSAGSSGCGCTGGVQIGSCNSNYQCPGQSVCQVGGQAGKQCMVCCYFHQPRQ